MEYTLIDVQSMPYKNDDKKKLFMLVGMFEQVHDDGSQIQTERRIAVVDYNTCKITYDNIDCPTIAINNPIVLEKAVDTLLAYYYKQSKEMFQQLKEVSDAVQTTIMKGKEYANSSIFNMDSKKKLIRRVEAIENSTDNAYKFYEQTHNYIILYVYTTIFKTLCNKDPQLFSHAIKGTYEETKQGYKFNSGIGLKFSILKGK